MYSVIILGATGIIGLELVKQFSVQKSHFKRLAFLTALADAGPEKEARYSKVEQQLERVVGSFSDPASYKGFDIVISVVGDDLCAQQHEFIDAAFAAGVKHFFPGEFGADLTHPKVRNELYWQDKIATRKHLEKRVREDPTLGYSYVMVGLFAEAWFTYNIAGLSSDKKSVTFVGHPDAKITTTAISDVAKFTIASLLPAHLTSLAGPRELRFEGSTITFREFFQAIEKFTGLLDIKYITYEDSFKEAKKLWDAGVFTFPSHFLVAQRGLGFGGGANLVNLNKEYPEIVAVHWEEVVKIYLGIGGLLS